MTAKLTAVLAAGGSRLDITIGGKGNVVDAEVVAAIGAAIDEHAGSPRLRAVLFTGAGDDFSLGASVAEHLPAQAAGMLERFHGLFHRLGQLAIPTVAVVRGRCLGGGLELAAWCTWLFAGPTARFGQPEIKLAVFPPMASLLLPWRIGGGAALDLCVSGRTIDAETAVRIGLVQRIDADPMAAAVDFLTRELQPMSPSSLRFAERAARIDLLRRMQQDLPALERLYLDELMSTPDAVEGIQAFVDRRKPVWRGGDV